MAEMSDSVDYDCEFCPARFDDEAAFIAHVEEAHGYKLATEEEAAQLEAQNEEDVPHLETQEKQNKKNVQEEKEAPLLEENGRVKEDHSPLSMSSRYHARWAGRDLLCCICGNVSMGLQQHRLHLRVAHPEIKVFPEYTCQHCGIEKFYESIDRDNHEQTCPDMELLRCRQSALTGFVCCPWCDHHNTNNSELGAHMLIRHSDVLELIRKSDAVVSELLPFRCSSCLVGFEDLRVLENHWRARELLGIPCRGELVVFNYLEKVKEFEQCDVDVVRRLPVVSADQMDDEDDDEIPRDPPPFLPPLMDVHKLAKCKCCGEQWPVAQMKMHYKNEHPHYHYSSAQRKCRRCNLVGFHNTCIYADHYEACESMTSPGPIHSSHPDVAPRCSSFASLQHFPSLLDRDILHRDIELVRNAARRAIPELAWAQDRKCRLCRVVLHPKQLMEHMKEHHALRHFTDAPYPCLRCGEVAFYRHAEYAAHSWVCHGHRRHSNRTVNLYSIVLDETTMIENNRTDFSAYRSCFDDVREKGTLSALDWTQQCGLCTSKTVSGRLRMMVPHVSIHINNHGKRLLPLVCKGCGFQSYLDPLIDHAIIQNKLGNIQCFNMIRLYQNPVKPKINLIALRDVNNNNNDADGDALLASFWMKEVQFRKLNNARCPAPKMIVSLPRAAVLPSPIRQVNTTGTKYSVRLPYSN